MPTLKDRWISGRTLILTRHHGMTYRQAFLAAVLEYQEQEEMARAS